MAKLNALRSVGNFDGSSDIERWIDRMEMAMGIDGIEDSKHAVVLSFHLEGAAFDTWKGLSEDGRKDAAVIKAELRSVFGLGRMEAWNLATASGTISPGDTVDVAFEGLKKLVGKAVAGDDPVGRVAACLLIARLSPQVREQVLLQCGKDMVPAAVVACAKQLISATSTTRGLSAAASRSTPNNAARRHGQQDKSTVRCFQCQKLGHYKHECKEVPPTHAAVSGNGRTGQPRV